MARKTVNVADLLEYANYNLEHGKDDKAKESLRSMIESVLHATGNYHGFSHNFCPLNDRENFEKNKNNVCYVPNKHLVKEYMDLLKVRHNNNGFRSIGEK